MRNLLYRLGSTAARHPLRIVLLWLVLAAGVLGARSAVGGEPVDSFDIPGAESQAAVDLIEARFPGLTGTTSRVVFHTDAGRIDRPPRIDAVRAALDRVAALPEIGAVSDPFDPAQAAVSADGTTAYATLHYSVRFDELTSDDLDALRSAAAPAEDAGLQVEIGGAVADFGDQETGGKEGIGLLVAVVVLVVALGAVSAMVLPIGLALFALTVGTALLGLLAARRRRARRHHDARHDDRSRRRDRLRPVRPHPLPAARRLGPQPPRSHRPGQRHGRSRRGVRRSNGARRHPRPPGVRHPCHRDDGLRHRGGPRRVRARRGHAAACAARRLRPSHRWAAGSYPPPTSRPSGQARRRAHRCRSLGWSRGPAPRALRSGEPRVPRRCRRAGGVAPHRVLRRRRRVDRPHRTARLRPAGRGVRTRLQRTDPRRRRPRHRRRPAPRSTGSDTSSPRHPALPASANRFSARRGTPPS